MICLDTRRMGLQLISLVVGIVLSSGTDTKADFSFGTPVNIGLPPNGAHADLTPSIAGDGLEVYFWSNRPGGLGSWDLWVSTRISTEEAWQPATNLGAEVNGGGIEAMPCISANGLELFFARGSEAVAELMVARRATKTQPWGTARNLGHVVNSSTRDDSPKLTSDGLELYFVSTRPGGRGMADIWMSRRPTITDDWQSPVNLSSVNSSAYDQWANVSADGLVLLFQSTRSGGEYGGLYMSRRERRDDPWPAPVDLGLPMEESVYTLLSSISPDGTMLYLSDHINYAPRAGGVGSADIWQVPVVPTVDFNCNGVMDTDDILRLIASWGQDDPTVDIGPTPFGDGKIGAKDLEVLMSYWGQPVDDPTLVAHWALDETEGNVAYDSAGVNDAFVTGEPVWLPEDGKFGGTLAFDGVDDCAFAQYAPNPADGPFSFFAWIQGGAPGQVVISQLNGTNWLCADPTQGCLMTELCASGRNGGPLRSEMVISDGSWHRLGFVWDGMHRALYVDDILVAEDSQTGLSESIGGLNIGCGSDITAGTFWSGLIDDVRIYNRAVSP